MRPSILYALFSPIENLSGIGRRYTTLLAGLCGNRIVDLLWHFPVNIVDRRCNVSLSSAQNGQIWSGAVTVVEHIVPKTRKQPYKIVVEDKSEQLVLVFFKLYGNSLTDIFPVGAKKYISGKIEIFNNLLTMAHPDYVLDAKNAGNMPQIEAIYPLRAGISNKMLLKFMAQALEKLPQLPEWIDHNLLRQKNWPSFNTALDILHHPQNICDINPRSPSRLRLAYDELLANQLSLAIVRRKLKHKKGRILQGNGVLRKKLFSCLEFELTAAQQRVIAQIDADMASPYRMSRLLQGDVGSGKTIVALATMLNAVECNTQACIMAPTEILAQQHFETISEYCGQLGVNAALLTSSIKGKKRLQILDDLKAGKINILIGTHAVFTENVEFKDLAYAVVDEQHRFGVKQRLSLTQKGSLCDVLVMTATPIPRTLVLTMYGDMDYSKIDELPSGRKPVETSVISIGKIDEVVKAVARKAASSSTQAYWVCPLVEESEKTDLSAACERYEALKKIFGNNVGLVHGKMKEAEKKAVMDDFKDGKIKLLVSTTVIEVGVNVPNATLMIVEHAERFGLAQLHQLRGRIKRSSEAANCILLYGYPLSQTSRERLETLKNTEDGFEIAQKDLQLRGAGEILGTKQTGFAIFKIADLTVHEDLLQIAHKQAELILNQNPDLQGADGENLRTLLYLFEQDEAIRTYNAG